MSVLTADLQKDVRLIERNLAKGFVSRAEVAKRIVDLPDTTPKAEWIDIEGGTEDEADQDGD